MEFDALFARWKKWLGEQKLDRIPGLRVLPRKLSEGQDNTGRTADLSGMLPDDAYRFVRLGDMLRDQSRPAAAAIEYRKGTHRTDYISPHLQVRLARMEVRSGQLDSAESTLRKMARYYPDHLPLYLTRSELLQSRKQYAEATRALETALHINPFDPRVHQGLGTLYGLTGQKEKRRREERVLRRIYEWLKW
jgi:tetratricopeptide (TPR) repeat protein